MKPTPSAAFRQLCLAMAFLVVTWVRPERAHADAYPLHTEQVVADTLKPNVLIVLEAVETMQGLPGENQARYNEVGADCEDGSRQCRLVGQVGRWKYTGMGSKGITFGDPSATCTSTVTNTVTSTNSTTVTDSSTGTVTQTNTDAQSSTVTSTVLGTQTATESQTATGTWSGTIAQTATQSETSTQTSTFTQSSTNTLTQTATGYATVTPTATATKITCEGVSTITLRNDNVAAKTKSWTATLTRADTGTHFNATSGTGTYVDTGITYTGTGTTTAPLDIWFTAVTTSTDTMTVAANYTGALSKTACATGTATGVTNITWTYTRTTTGAATATRTDTQTDTNTRTDTITQTNTKTSTSTVTNTVTNTSTTTVTNTKTNTTTVTDTNTNTVSSTVTVTNTSSWTATGTYTDTSTSVHQYTCGTAGSVDMGNCDLAKDTTKGKCNVASGTDCTSELACSDVKGDFCRFISASDQSGRTRNEPCVSVSESPWGSCKHGITTANKTCSSGDATCSSDLAEDYCAEGLPAKMCADSGLWCSDSSDCPGNASTDTCSGATSRMMTVKRALRRAMSEHADKVNFGFMSSYQGKGVGSTNLSTDIFPYVRLKSCPAGKNATETKLISRGELEKAGCFSASTGPTSTCTIDYGGGGAVNTDATANQITYSLVGTSECPVSDNSRWAIPRGNGSGKSSHADASWTSCASSFPTCAFSAGTGIYEGSYYCFKYEQGAAIDDGGVAEEGSMKHPKYLPTYKGKFFRDGSVCYSAIDAERSDTINDGIFGRPAYTGHPYDSNNEVAVPWSGVTNAAACTESSGAIRHSNVVPFLTDSTFGAGSTPIDRTQKLFMMTARLEKASFGGLDATGTVEPISCVLQNEGAADRDHSAATYMSTVQSNDIANNGSKTPCWPNSIVLVVDGQANGFGDEGNGIDCASEACARSEDAEQFQSCACPAIAKAYALAHSSTPVQTHVVVNAPNWPNDGLSWSVRYRYTYAFLNNLAKAGSLSFDGTATFGTTEDEVYRAISDKIAAAAYHFTYTTGAPVAGPTRQDPETELLTYSRYLYDTSVSYPSWKGTLVAYDTSSGGAVFKWDSAGQAAAGHPANWTYRRIFFGDKTSHVKAVEISGNDPATATITNASDLYNAGLGSSSAEADRIMQWLLGRPGLGNPTPHMGSITSSAPVVVGQAAPNGLNGSTEYSKATWPRPELVYVGSDDGMLHAFFAQMGSLSLGGTTYAQGEEAFAFIPNDMLPVITKLYAQGGQKLPVDKSQHIFGLAASPKVKDICIGTACNDSNSSDWHTVLFMSEGPGGNKPFALDITKVIDESGLHPGKVDGQENLKLLWSVATATSDMNPSSWGHLGETTAAPGFYYSPSAGENRAIFASGYALPGSSTSDIYIVNANAATGEVKELRNVSGVSVPYTCPTGPKRAIVADVGVARRYSSDTTSQHLLAAYLTDTWGHTFQYVQGAVPTLLYSRDCYQPSYFAPAVVQLDRSPKMTMSAAGLIYLVQVTNSNLDPDTIDNGHYSEMLITKLDGSGGAAPVIVPSFNPGGAVPGQIRLSTNPNPTTVGTQICIQDSNNTSFSDGMKSAAQSCETAGGKPLPEKARPIGTPTAVLRSDGLGFQVITGWFDPSARANDCSSGGQYNYGTSYVTVHEFGADGTWYQIAGVSMPKTVLTGMAFIATGLFIDGLTTTSTPQAPPTIGEAFDTMQQIGNAASRDRYARTAWTEFSF